jgi:hypothetical protein
MMQAAGDVDMICILVLVTAGIAFLTVLSLVSGLLKALLTHGFPFVIGTDTRSPLSLNASCLG